MSKVRPYSLHTQFGADMDIQLLRGASLMSLKCPLCESRSFATITSLQMGQNTPDEGPYWHVLCECPKCEEEVETWVQCPPGTPFDPKRKAVNPRLERVEVPEIL